MFNQNVLREGLFKISVVTVTPVDPDDEPYLRYDIEFMTTKWEKVASEYTFTKALEFINHESEDFVPFMHGLRIGNFDINFCKSSSGRPDVCTSLYYNDKFIETFDNIEEAIKASRGELDEQRELLDEE